MFTVGFEIRMTPKMLVPLHDNLPHAQLAPYNVECKAPHCVPRVQKALSADHGMVAVTPAHAIVSRNSFLDLRYTVWSITRQPRVGQAHKHTDQPSAVCCYVM